MATLTIDDLKKPAERPFWRDVPLPNGKTANFRGMLEGELLEFQESLNGESLRTGLIVATLADDDGELMLTIADTRSDWWAKLDAAVVTAMFTHANNILGFDAPEFDPEREAKN